MVWCGVLWSGLIWMNWFSLCRFFLGPLMVRKANMPVYIGEIWDVTSVHRQTDKLCWWTNPWKLIFFFLSGYGSFLSCSLEHVDVVPVCSQVGAAFLIHTSSNLMKSVENASFDLSGLHCVSAELPQGCHWYTDDGESHISGKINAPQQFGFWLPFALNLIIK